MPVRRIVFNEITKEAVQHAIANPRDVDMHLVDAQETRRILDRLYGYEVSPVLWKKIMSGLSAGRVQSVATRLVVERERVRIAFHVASYWDLEATFDAGEGHDPRTVRRQARRARRQARRQRIELQQRRRADGRRRRAPRRGRRDSACRRA